MLPSAPTGCACCRAFARRSIRWRISPKSRAEMSQWVYRFGEGKADGRADMKNLLGGKGANLAERSHRGLPVPPGFTITTEVCTFFYQNGKTYPGGLDADVQEA